jgi:hypothetical protein
MKNRQWNGKKKLVPVSKSTLHQMTCWYSCFCIPSWYLCHLIPNYPSQWQRFLNRIKIYIQHTSHKWLHAWSQWLHYWKSWVLATRQDVISGFILQMHLAGYKFFSLNKMFLFTNISNVSYYPTLSRFIGMLNIIRTSAQMDV